MAKKDKLMRKLKNSELDRLNIDEFKQTSKIPVCILLDNIRSANNVGSVFRTSDAFLIQEIILSGFTPLPPNPEIHKTALGSTDSVDWKHFETGKEAMKYLKENQYEVIAIEQVENSTSLPDFKPQPNKKYALIFGNEVKGVDQEIVDMCDLCIEIPQYGTKHSLNISVSAGVVLWDIFKKIRY